MSTNPYYDGNKEGVIAHLRNTLKAEFNPAAYFTWDKQIDALVTAIIQRWHLTPARDYVDDGFSLANENKALHARLRLLHQFDAITGELDILEEKSDSLKDQLANLEQEAAAYGGIEGLTRV